MSRNFDLIRESVPLADLIGADIDLKRSGRDRLKACCPFHDDSTPSFVVYRETNKFYCFGCEEQGDAVDYVMKMKGYASPMEAMQDLAHRYNLHLENVDTETIQRKKKMIQEKRNDFVGYYRKAAEAGKFLQARGFTDNHITSKVFNIGYDDENHAFVIPFFNEYGELVGKVHRYLGEGVEPKYKNSAEDEVFKKNELLFGFDKARKQMKADGEDKLFLVEGYFDCMAMYQLGVGKTAAYASAHVSDAQADLIKRHVNKKTKIYLVPDNDDAGHKAVRKNVETLQRRVKNNISIVTLPEGIKDMNDFLLEGHTMAAVQSEPSNMYLLKEELDACMDEEDEYDVAREWSERTKNDILRYDMAQYLAERWNKPLDIVNDFMKGKAEVNHDTSISTFTEAYVGYVDMSQNPDAKIMFGISGLDRHIKGVRQTEVVFVYGKSGSAKTTFVLNWIYRLTMQQKQKSLFSSLELAKEMIAPQLVQIHKNETSGNVEKQAKSTESMDEAVASLSEEMDKRFRIADKDSQSINDIENYIRIVNESIFEDPIRVLFVDYFQYIKMDSSKSRYEATSEVAREFKALAKRLNIVVVVLTQVNREKGGGGHGKLSMESAKETGAIEESSDYVLGLSRPASDPEMDEDERIARQHEMWCQVLKARWSPQGDIKLWFDGMTKRIEDGEGRF